MSFQLPWDHPHPIKGKSKLAWVARTFCDFNQAPRRVVVGHHYSLESAERQFNRIRKRWPSVGSRFWTEARDGTILHDNQPPQ